VQCGFAIIGESADDQSGWSVSSAGDVNGDGLDDLIVGAKNAKVGKEYSSADSPMIAKPHCTSLCTTPF
jgi:hypothetical protein